MDDDRQRASVTHPDVGAILEELRAAVRARRLALEPQTQHPLERDLQRCLDEIELYRVVSAHWPLLGRNLPERVLMLINKLVRRYLRWYINPIVEQQNAYNDVVARTLRLLAEAYAELGEQIANTRLADTPPPSPGAGGQRLPDAEAARAANQAASPVATDRPSIEEAAPATDHAPPGSAPQARLMALVRARAATEPPARFPDLALRALEPQLRQRQHVTAHWPLTGRTAMQRVVALINKLVRRYLRWYINPIVEQQNAANAAFTAALLALIRLDAERRAQVAALRAKGRGPAPLPPAH